MKTLIIASCLTLASLSCLAQGITDSLILFYPFNGNAEDYSGNGHHGFAQATLIPDRLGNLNSAYSFNGVNEFIDFPNDSELKPTFPVSFSMWVNFHDFAANHSVVFTSDYGIDNHAGAWLNFSVNGRISVNYGNAGGGTTSAQRNTKQSENDLTTNVWFHIALIIRGYNDMEIYINGANDGGTYNGSATTMNYTSTPGSIGRKDLVSTAPYYFDGYLDDFYMWNRELTLSEIDSLFGDLYQINPMSISGLQASYCGSDPADILMGAPAGGYFTGPGISGNVFTPGLAGNGPVQISYIVGNDTVISDTYISNPVVDLGNDTSIVQGSSLILDAGSGFSSYIWSTLETTSSIEVISSGTYSVSVTDSYGCDDSDYIFVDVLNNVGSESLTPFKLYPNPAVDYMHLSIPSNNPFSWEIVDINGKTVQVGNTPIIYIYTLNPGFYGLRICQDGMSSGFKRFVKN